MINRKQLLSMIEEMETFSPSNAKIKLEQYATDAIASVELGFIAGIMHADLQERLVIDLGAGTGRLSITCLFFGAWRVIGVEIDLDAIKIARDNAKKFGFDDKLDLIIANVSPEKFIIRRKLNKDDLDKEITIVMNPPFGVHDKGADLRFLMAAINVPRVRVIYSFHLKNERNRQYIRNKMEKVNWEVVSLYQTEMFIPRLYKFHEKTRKKVEVDIYRIMPVE
ncbi:MAG: METTL5 family protein [Promethearchaeota archaeon]